VSRPTRQDSSGRAFLDLQNLAKRQGRDTGELLTIYALEGFLARLAASPRTGDFVLKGGVLLAAYGARRPTRDVDLLATALSNDLTIALAAVREIAGTDIADGLHFETDTATAQTIRDEDAYTGIRVAITARLATAILPIHIDINVGDPVSPPAGPIVLPRLLGGHITITGYPIAMVHAEKIVTAIQRGTANTRWRDFADIYLLSTRQPVEGADLQQALSAVAAAREATLIPLENRLRGYPDLAQRRWAAWVRKYRLSEAVPNEFSDALQHIYAFADPALRGEVGLRHWHPVEREWRE
jgi:hypothetical protein